MKVNQTSQPITPATTEAYNAAKTQNLESKKLDAKNLASKTEDKVLLHPDAKTTISPKAQELATAKSIAKNTPDIRENKVADLKKRIEEGSYKLDPQVVADKMIDEHLKL